MGRGPAHFTANRLLSDGTLNYTYDQQGTGTTASIQPWQRNAADATDRDSKRRVGMI
jgi:hypothetical protein